MKFGKDYKRQMVPEWVEAYMDYNGLKKILREIRLSQAQKLPPTPLRTLQQRFSMYSPFRGVEVEARNQKREGDIEDQIIQVSPFVGESNITFYRTRLLFPSEEIGGEDEVKFFKKLDQELNKVNAFYRDKVDEVVKEAAELKKQLEACIALRIKVQNSGIKESDTAVAMDPKTTTNQEAPSINNTGGDRNNTGSRNDESDVLKVLNHVKINTTLQGPLSMIRGILGDFKEKALSFSKEELKLVEEKLKIAFTEFYQKLRLLKNYSFMNLSAFAKIMKKYEKTTSRYAARSYMKIVDKSYLGSCDVVTKLIEDVEHMFVKHFFNANRREGMKPLRPRKRREKHSVSFLSGLFSGCSIALAIAIILMVRARKILEKEKGSVYMENMFGLYSLFLFIVLHMLMYAADIYFWKRYRVNYPFIFNFKQGTEQGYREVFLLGAGLAVLSLSSFLANFDMLIGLTTENDHSPAKFIPLIVLLVFLGITFCPFNIIYRSSRYFLIQCLFRCICAPFYEVTLPDFFLADQLTSQVQAIRSIEFYICYYIHKGFPEGQSKCHSYGVYNAFYFVVAIIPYWIRCFQCLRRLVQERDSIHAYNAMKYLMAVVAVVIRTLYELKSGTAWLVLALLSSAMAVAYNTYWDIVIDWGLLRRNSKNYLLRNRLLVSHKSVYYIAMVVNVLLRVAWLQLVLEFNIKGLRKTALSTTMSCLEIIRRGIWNFFRLENEHLNNVGRFRAFRSVPLPFNYHDQDDTDDDNDDYDYEKVD
ncbi:phosphate transporter PHO1 homolog 10-like [Amaranthus tricolor]|uniref:phosphate transporter PHO1 homolog 10-like n=1 Tax=Amaranthus tricolor TaxID=29722 RepID=UPI0025837476|nr:phosphate transporter PHO1 homolog 10-like [Amaranthus tricolor]XP_057530740.1 phosphate transporter PHO1 homolog 10-like [Amaranthus tricolor]XP_057530741.1 phosphate transporter PHO1 homolog 10-like [Amaranthus tricolor]